MKFMVSVNFERTAKTLLKLFRDGKTRVLASARFFVSERILCFSHGTGHIRGQSEKGAFKLDIHSFSTAFQ